MPKTILGLDPPRLIISTAIADMGPPEAIPVPGPPGAGLAIKKQTLPQSALLWQAPTPDPEEPLMGTQDPSTGCDFGDYPEHRSRWYVPSKTYPPPAQEGSSIRKFIHKKYASAGNQRNVLIARSATNLR